jgi:hypothetical protein
MITECPPAGSSIENYMRFVPEGDLIDICIQQMEEVTSLISNLSEEAAEYRYASGKWSVKEVLGHLADTERVCTYRLLCAARGDSTPMPSFDEKEYVIQGNFHKRPILDLLNEWKTVREASISLLRSLTKNSLQNEGTFRNRPNKALLAACIIPAHVGHHINVLHERYGI